MCFSNLSAGILFMARKSSKSVLFLFVLLFSVPAIGTQLIGIDSDSLKHII